MPDLVLYHSPQPLPARLAAAVHLGRLPQRPPPWAELQGALDALATEPVELLRPAPGVRNEGRDAAGRRVCSLGTGSGSGVIERACNGLAQLAGIPPHAYVVVALPDLPVWVRAWAWLVPPAQRRTAALAGLRATWPRCAAAAAIGAAPGDMPA